MVNNLVDGAIKKILSLIVGVENKCKVMQGATSSAAGKAGLVPAPSAGDTERYLRADGTWVNLRAYQTVEVTLATDNWEMSEGDGYTYTVSNNKVTANNTIVIAPKQPVDAGALKGVEIDSIVQQAGNLIFVSKTKPNENIDIILYIYKEG